MKRMIVLLFFCGVFLYNGSARAEAAAAAVIEEKTGRVLYADHEEAEMPMASTTKIMTAMLAIERCGLNETVTAGINAYGVPGTSIYLDVGESLRLEDMLYGLMLASGNDAAVAIAEHVGGSVEAFCDLMNARAASLGCIHTHYATPHGLPAENHYTSALDLCVIAREAMRLPFFRQVVSTQRATIPWAGQAYDRVLTNKNKLLSTYPGAIGVKTGYTKAAGRCLVFAAEREGMTLIGSVLNCPDWFDHSAALLDAVFSEYRWYTALQAGEIVHWLAVEGGTSSGVDVLAAETLGAPLRAEEKAEIRFSLPDTLQAGFAKGEKIGEASLVVSGDTLYTVPLITADAVPERSFPYGWKNALQHWLLLAE